VVPSTRAVEVHSVPLRLNHENSHNLSFLKFICEKNICLRSVHIYPSPLLPPPPSLELRPKLQQCQHMISSSSPKGDYQMSMSLLLCLFLRTPNHHKPRLLSFSCSYEVISKQGPVFPILFPTQNLIYTELVTGKRKDHDIHQMTLF
jgi:hypothetical protein